MTISPHLSIGEVLNILHDEFPDITISKIRFLESQGLIEPERTPSGYRRFYEPDLSRIRWILVQQRDHFLPLKVIKDRLDSGFIPPGREDDLRAVGGPPTTPGEPFHVTQAAAVDAAESSGVTRAMAVPSSAGGDHESVASIGPSDSDVDPSSPDGVGHIAGGAPTADGSETGVVGDADLVSDNGGSAERAGEGTASDFASWTPPRLSRSPRRGDTGETESARRATDLSSVSLTLQELSSASGLDAATLNELGRYGVIAGREVNGAMIYGDDALLAARLAGRFAAYGIEPRHIRSYRVAADKEMALFDQVVAPLMRQRHPQGVRAADSLAELGELGEQMRRVLLERLVREYLGQE